MVARSTCAHNVTNQKKNLTPFGLGFFRVPGLPGRGGGEVPRAYNSKTINGIEMEFGWVVKNHEVINLVWFD